jgi:iron-sulfur cluster assembly accessory protein
VESVLEITDAAIQKILQKQKEERFDYIRLGITGGGCAGFSYVFTTTDVQDSDDIALDYGKFKVLIDKLSLPYIFGMTLDFVKEGLNEIFKFNNPKEESACGCGVSINFDLDKVDHDRITAIQI